MFLFLSRNDVITFMRIHGMAKNDAAMTGGYLVKFEENSEYVIDECSLNM